MATRVDPSRRSLLATVLAVVLVAVACEPGDGATPAATSAEGPVASDRMAALATPAPTRRATDAPTSGGTPAPTSAGTPDPTAAPTATPSPPDPTVPPTTTPEPGPYAMNLADADDFVRQYTFEWCVGASLQMALNMATDEQRDGRGDQERLWEMARDRSFSPFGGANPRGWTQALNDLGIGPYELVSLPSFEDAVTTAAAAIRATDRPVGLVMWRGRHAWVMSGFEATADPRHADEFEVTRIRVHDPLYPHGSSVWGPSPKPNSLVSPETLARQFVLRDSTRVNLGVGPGWLLVLPVAEAA